MIAVYALPVSALPSEQEMLSALPVSMRLPWEKAHAGLHRAEQRRTSLGCLHLLSHSVPHGTLAYQPNGRPYFTDLPVTFSLSHSEQLVVCAVCRTEGTAAPPPSIGVDTESLSRIALMDYRALCRRYATGAERQVYLPEPSAEQFLRLWTRKEALLKQTGKGLSGLSEADTESATRNVRFAEYRSGDNLISLCIPKDSTPPPLLSEIS